MREERTLNEPLLQVKGLKKYFPVTKVWRQEKTFVRAVDGIDLSIDRGETLAWLENRAVGRRRLEGSSSN